MIKSSIIKIQRVSAVNGNQNSKQPHTKKKSNILDFAGAWNDLPNEKLKALDTTLQQRRKTSRRASV